MSLNAPDLAVNALRLTLLCLFILGRRLFVSRFTAPARYLRAKPSTNTKLRLTSQVY